MRTVEKRIERLEAIHGGHLSLFPDLTGLAVGEAEIAIKTWLTSVINRPFKETPEKLCGRIIAELAPQDQIALAKYLVAMEAPDNAVNIL